MAVIHQAKLTPTKLEALAAWLPQQPWSGVDADAADQPELLQVARFRLDDPAGEVGLEVIVVRAGDGPLLQTPLSYRGAPLEGAEEFLVTTMDHSVLGPRWVYDAVGDPVFADVARRTIVTGAHEAEMMLAVDGKLEPAPKGASAWGSGSAPDSPTITSVEAATDGPVTTVTTAAGALLVLRVLDGGVSAGETLTAQWGEEPERVLAVVPQ